MSSPFNLSGQGIHLIKSRKGLFNKKNSSGLTFVTLIIPPCDKECQSKTIFDFSSPEANRLAKIIGVDSLTVMIEDLKGLKKYIDEKEHSIFELILLSIITIVILTGIFIFIISLFSSLGTLLILLTSISVSIACLSITIIVLLAYKYFSRRSKQLKARKRI